jgi:hypothetical protein
LAVDEVIVKYKGRVGFWQYIPKKRKQFGIKLCKLCDSKGCTCDEVAYHGKQCANAAENVTPTHGTVLKLVRKVEGVGHKLFMDTYFSSPQLFSDLCSRKINSCSTIRHNRKGMPANFGPKMLKLKKGDLLCKVKGGASAVC